MKHYICKEDIANSDKNELWLDELPQTTEAEICKRFLERMYGRAKERQTLTYRGIMKIGCGLIEEMENEE